MWIFDDWLDLIRVAAFVVGIYCTVLLLIRFKRHGKTYNSKTKDIWFSMVMFSIAGVVAMVQGLVLDRPFTPAFVCIVAAIFAGGKAVRQKGPWGGNAV